MKNLKYILISVLLYITACQSTIPVTIHGKSMPEYVSAEKLASNTLDIYRRWKLISINHDNAPNNVDLYDLDVTLEFTQEQDSLGKILRGKSINGETFGYFNIDENGFIKIELIENNRSYPIFIPESAHSPQEKITQGFFRSLQTVSKYEVESTTLVLLSDQEILEFRLY